MTPDFKQMAIEAGMPGYQRRLAKFAAMIAEECAKGCDMLSGSEDEVLDTADYAYKRGAEYCAIAIREKFPVPVFVPGRKKVPKKPSATVAAKRVAKAERNAQIVARIKAGEKRSAIACDFNLMDKTIGYIAKHGGIAPGTRFTRE